MAKRTKIQNCDYLDIITIEEKKYLFLGTIIFDVDQYYILDDVETSERTFLIFE
jgi:hypothetical protein